MTRPPATGHRPPSETHGTYYLLVSPQMQRTLEKDAGGLYRETGHRPQGSLRISPAHISAGCSYLQARPDSNGCRVLEIDASILADMFPDIGFCRKCCAFQIATPEDLETPKDGPL
jgi:hypothetical protein